MVPIPVALGMTLCDYVIIEEKTRKISLIGTFDSMVVDHTPVLANPFSIYSVLINGHGEGVVKVVVNCLETDEEVDFVRNQLNFPDRFVPVKVHFRLSRLTLPTLGWYEVSLLIDEEWVAQCRFHVKLKGKQS
ncbi:MAG: DUF6941 family protein [Gemmataceae bacterium]